jgi:two-component system chemotaxis response regulator CheB
MIRILIATDSASDRDTILALLSSNPEYSVIAQADNGIEAVDLAVQLEPDLIAMDIEMPLLDGIEATREIMSRAPTRIVVLSSGVDGPDLGRGSEALKAGAVTVVPKPAGPGPFSDLRREIFLEMMRAATRKDIRTRKDFDATPAFLANDWVRPSTAFQPLEAEPVASDIDFDRGFDMLGLPLTVEDRAARIRRLMDDIR